MSQFCYEACPDYVERSRSFQRKVSEEVYENIPIEEPSVTAEDCRTFDVIGNTFRGEHEMPLLQKRKALPVGLIEGAVDFFFACINDAADRQTGEAERGRKGIQGRDSCIRLL